MSAPLEHNFFPYFHRSLNKPQNHVNHTKQNILLVLLQLNLCESSDGVRNYDRGNSASKALKVSNDTMQVVGTYFIRQECCLN